MIEAIRIRGLGVIEDATFEPHPGFTAVTGETGAGKTMVLTGLGLLLGERADAGAVRAGDARADVEGRFTVAATSGVAARVREAGGELDEGALLMARTVNADGRSRAYVAARAVPAALLSELADSLVAVHGQSDQQRLLQPSAQRTALDCYATGVAGPYAAYRDAWERLRTTEVALADVLAHGQERAALAEQLRLGLADVEAAAPSAGEDVALRAEADRLGHAAALQEAAAIAHTALSGAEDEVTSADALSLLVSARRALEAQGRHDPALAGLQERLAELCSLAADVSADLGSYLAGLEADPRRLASVEERRAVLGALTRKYGPTVDEVLAWAGTAAEQLAALTDDEGRVVALTAARDSARADVQEHGRALSAERTTAAAKFAAAVTAELVDLAMPQARVVVDVRALPEPGPHGYDEVELRLAPRAGAPARPLARAASGGELSRVMLAIEVVLAGTEPVPSMVFDEVDAGVGGRAAVEVGRRLARLSRTTQVLVVTHLPQVAAFADRQVVVDKSDDGTVTTAGLRTVTGAERVRELARMMAGLESSQNAAAHATELLELAEKDRAPSGRRDRKARR